MILMGDEARRSQSGNNNAYCQDNEISWFDWTLLEKHAEVHRFVSLLNAGRLERDAEHEHRRLSLNQLLRQASKAWHGVKVGQPDWSDHSHSLAFEAEPRGRAPRVPDPERTGSRSTSSCRRSATARRPVAPMDRYRARIAAGHRAVAGRARVAR